MALTLLGLRLHSLRLLFALGLLGCAAEKQEALAPVETMGPREEIQRIGQVWQARLFDKGLRSAPSPISVFSTRTSSTVTLDPRESEAVEDLIVEETFKMRDGTSYVCHAAVRTPVRIQYGRRAGEPTLAVFRPALSLMRDCNPPGFAEAQLSIPETAAAFVLRGDQLAPFDPPLEKRVFLSVQ